MRIRVLAALVGTSFATCVSAQQPVILLFESDGALTWSNAYAYGVASIERLTDVSTTGSAATVTETLGFSDGSTAVYYDTVEHPPIIDPSVTIGDGTHSWNDVTGVSTNPPVLLGGVVDYTAGTVYASYLSEVSVAGTPIEVEYSYLPVSTHQEWLNVYSEPSTGEVSEAVMESSEDMGLFRVLYTPVPSDMVQIPGGSNSGTNPLGSGESYDNCEYPATYSLSVGSFYMDRYEVTNDKMVEVMQWAYDHGKVSATSTTVHNLQGNQQELLDMNDESCRITWDGNSFGMKAAQGSGYPCVEVTWYGAAAYCNYRSEMEGRTPCYSFTDWSCNFSVNGYRLPTSEEWEYAARGGAVSKRFPWGGNTISHDQANYYADNWTDYDLSSGGTHPSYAGGLSPVGAFGANGYGLYEMAGNVWEWCNDRNPCDALRPVTRGGTFLSWADGCRVGAWSARGPNLGDSYAGFRVVVPTGQ